MKNVSKKNKSVKSQQKDSLKSTQSFGAKSASTDAMIQNDPDVKAFIYQQIFELTPFLTPETVVTVVARNAKKLINEYDIDDVEETKKLLSKSHRIAFVLQEKDAKLEAEGLHENIYEAIHIAKDYLASHLAEIQNNVISNQDRQVEINQALQNNSTH